MTKRRLFVTVHMLICIGKHQTRMGKNRILGQFFHRNPVTYNTETVHTILLLPEIQHTSDQLCCAVSAKKEFHVQIHTVLMTGAHQLGKLFLRIGSGTIRSFGCEIESPHISPEVYARFFLFFCICFIFRNCLTRHSLQEIITGHQKKGSHTQTFQMRKLFFYTGKRTFSGYTGGCMFCQASHMQFIKQRILCGTIGTVSLKFCRWKITTQHSLHLIRTKSLPAADNTGVGIRRQHTIQHKSIVPGEFFQPRQTHRSHFSDIAFPGEDDFLHYSLFILVV